MPTPKAVQLKSITQLHIVDVGTCSRAVTTGSSGALRRIATSSCCGSGSGLTSTSPVKPPPASGPTSLTNPAGRAKRSAGIAGGVRGRFGNFQTITITSRNVNSTAVSNVLVFYR
jgi:hypothetical protein